MKVPAFLFLCCNVALCIQLHSQSYTTERSSSKLVAKRAIEPAAYSFNLRDVQLLPGTVFKNAMDKDAAYLLTIDADRLLHRFYTNAALAAIAPVYGGWESEGLSGHTLGHYLSACSMMYASTGNTVFKRKVDYIVSQLLKCQQARKTGYVGAIPNEDSIFGKLARGEIKSGGFDLNGGWSPWYTVHKLMAGLLDAYFYCDNKTALDIDKKMADWTAATLSKLDAAQLQQMLRCEYGGMNEVLANLYALTGQKKYLDLSFLFFDDVVMKALTEKKDPMPGKHSNTNVPKAIGSAAQFELTGNDREKTIATYFWQTMVQHHSYVIGGNSNYEYCGPEDRLNNRLSDNTCETCNTYNMLKLTKHLFAWHPDGRLGDYYERALYNHILSSQNPETGMMCYFVPLRMGTKKVFSDSFNTFTCCVGSGMENHSKYGEGTYFEGRDGSLYVNLFIASKLRWRTKGISIEQQTNYPDVDSTSLVLQMKTSANFAIKIRKPWWAEHGYTLSINGSPQIATEENGFVVANRNWHNGDRIVFRAPMNLYTESMPDNANRVAILYGPLVLAGQLGTTQPDPVYGTPVLLAGNKKITEWIEPVKDTSLVFQTVNVVEPTELKLIPFYKTYSQYYSVYWDYFSPEQWASREVSYEKEKTLAADLDRRTIDNFRIGEMQPERDHNLQSSEQSYVSDALGVKGREARAGNFFSFQMRPHYAAAGNSLVLTYIGDDDNRKFDIKVNGRLVATEELKAGEAGRFYNKVYQLPGELIEHPELMTVRIEANYGKTAGRIFGARVITN